MTTTTVSVPDLRDYHYPKVYTQFLGYAKTHKMTVLRDDGLYRHLRFATPGTGIGRFDLITWPGYLTIVGDIGDGWTFAREQDMFPWFYAGEGRINPGYWWEKMPEPQRRSARGYDEDRFVQYVKSLVNDEVEYHGMNPDQRAAFERDVEDEILSVAYSRDEALAALRDFTYGYGRPGGEYRSLTDMTEPDGWTGYDHHFILACHAILWGVRQYTAETKAQVS